MSNRLSLEDSPYLQQHKDNPFDWYPWCDEAFARAKEEKKAIFISIGYSSCHWCHVMEEQVFTNSEIASFVNEHFICIKLDREERPDIDKHYQELHHLLNRRAGGWPLSIFCTPDNKPFYAATYIPPYTQNQMMGFSELTKIIADKIAQNDDKLFENADEIEKFMRPDMSRKGAIEIEPKMIDTFIKQASHNLDSTNGGFSISPKFPHSSTLMTLLSIDKIISNSSARDMLKLTLDNMAKGGMYDLVDGGFCRYSTDESWLVPHFEKMLYDNALLCELYAKAGAFYNDKNYELIATEIADFIIDFMSEDYLFFSASDADTEGEEGKYFIYSYNELAKIVDELNLPKSVLESIGASRGGNFEGSNIIRLDSLERDENFYKLKSKLQDLRKERLYPFIDKKIITAWNAMMIKSLFILNNIDSKYGDFATKSLQNLLKTLKIDEQLYHSNLIHSSPKIEGFLEDYAYLADALIEAYQSTLDEIYLLEAQKLANKALELYYDDGRWYFSKSDFITIAEADDSTYPSSMAVIVGVLNALGVLIDAKYSFFASKSIDFISHKLAKTPIYYPALASEAIGRMYGYRVVKNSSKNLRNIKMDYPFALVRNDEGLEEFLICGDSGCFANVIDKADLNSSIKNSIGGVE